MLKVGLSKPQILIFCRCRWCRCGHACASIEFFTIMTRFELEQSDFYSTTNTYTPFCGDGSIRIYIYVYRCIPSLEVGGVGNIYIYMYIHMCVVYHTSLFISNKSFATYQMLLWMEVKVSSAVIVRILWSEQIKAPDFAFGDASQHTRFCEYKSQVINLFWIFLLKHRARQGETVKEIVSPCRAISPLLLSLRISVSR